MKKSIQIRPSLLPRNGKQHKDGGATDGYINGEEESKGKKVFKMVLRGAWKMISN